MKTIVPIKRVPNSDQRMAGGKTRGPTDYGVIGDVDDAVTQLPPSHMDWNFDMVY